MAHPKESREPLPARIADGASSPGMEHDVLHAQAGETIGRHRVPDVLVVVV
jgi:hypothetical protein